MKNKRKKCLESCYEYLFEYNNICYDDCPSGTHKIYQNRNKCIVNVPENYYLDDDNIYKECYNNCKKCSKSGNESYNNCDECKEGYMFVNESSVPNKNCMQRCNYYYYINEDNQYICTETDICPTDYNKLVEELKKCTDECKNEDGYKYEYNNKCLKECPEGTKIYEEQKKI